MPVYLPRNQTALWFQQLSSQRTLIFYHLPQKLHCRLRGPPSSTMCLSSQQCGTKNHNNNAQQSTTTKHNKVQQCKVASTLTPRVQSQQEALMGWHWHTMGSDKRQPRSLFHLQQKWASSSSQTPIFKLKSTIGLREYVVSWLPYFQLPDFQLSYF